MIICITGTPGVGKTTFAKKYAKKTKSEYIDANIVINEHNLIEETDVKRKSFIVDKDAFIKIIIKKYANKDKTYVIDSHFSHVIPSQYVEKCIVCRCNLKELRERLTKRKYHKEKIDENIEAEICEVCLCEAQKLNHVIEEVWTSKNNITQNKNNQKK